MFIYNGSSQRDIHFQVDVLINMASKLMPKEKLSEDKISPLQSEVSCYDHLWSLTQARGRPNTSAMFENLLLFDVLKAIEDASVSEWPS